ncbi:hypothetical protein SKAU_G00334520 [Synaphobranchus kaupii]|uniref:Uncharacterized protein n=1 Tax=Synaphobranchus kaupii TaxID=118154 RepID=A0A9Q1IIT0_SYNKA|nr:hypothetical protein SKAU_G00334520 [Synaphobranchus kaupii]
MHTLLGTVCDEGPPGPVLTGSGGRPLRGRRECSRLSPIRHCTETCDQGGESPPPVQTPRRHQPSPFQTAAVSARSGSRREGTRGEGEGSCFGHMGESGVPQPLIPGPVQPESLTFQRIHYRRLCGTGARQRQHHLELGPGAAARDLKGTGLGRAQRAGLMRAREPARDPRTPHRCRGTSISIETKGRSAPSGAPSFKGMRPHVEDEPKLRAALAVSRYPIPGPRAGILRPSQTASGQNLTVQRERGRGAANKSITRWPGTGAEVSASPDQKGGGDKWDPWQMGRAAERGLTLHSSVAERGATRPRSCSQAAPVPNALPFICGTGPLAFSRSARPSKPRLERGTRYAEPSRRLWNDGGSIDPFHQRGVAAELMVLHAGNNAQEPEHLPGTGRLILGKDAGRTCQSAHC